MKRITMMLAVCLCAVLMVGCNTTGTFISATGAYVRAGPVTIVVGTVDASNSAGEFANEIVSVRHTTYFDTSIDTGASTGEAGVTAEKKSEYTFTVTPVEADEEGEEEGEGEVFATLDDVTLDTIHWADSSDDLEE